MFGVEPFESGVWYRDRRLALNYFDLLASRSAYTWQYIDSQLSTTFDGPCNFDQGKGRAQNSAPVKLGIIMTISMHSILHIAQAVTPFAAFCAACCGLIFFPSLLNRTRGGGARLRRPSRERTLITTDLSLLSIYS